MTHASVNPISRLTLVYIIALGLVAILLIVSQMLVHSQLENQISDSHVVNIAGRQRMLSQRLSKNLLILHQNSLPFTQRQSTYQDLKSSFELWTQAHIGLQEGSAKMGLSGNNSAKVQSLFNQLEPHFNLIYQAIRPLQATSKSDSLPKPELVEAALNQTLKHEKAFLEGMNQITYQYDREAQQAVLYLQKTDYVLTLIILLVLVIEGWLIFRPITLKIQNYTQTIQNQKNEIEIQNADYQSLNEELNQSIEEIKNTNEQLSASENKFRKLVESVHFGVFIYNQTRILYANPICEKVFGYDAEELLHIQLAEVFPNDYNILNDPQNFTQNATLELVYRQDTKVVSSTGTLYWLDLTATPFNHKTDELTFVASFVDITDKKRIANRLQDAYQMIAENQSEMRGILLDLSMQKQQMNNQSEVLRRANEDILVTNQELEKQKSRLAQALIQLKITENRFRALFEKSDDSFMILQNGRIVDCNPATLRLFEYDDKLEINEDLAALSPPTQPDGRSSFKKAQELVRVAYQKGYNRFEWLFQKNEGETFFADVSINAIKILDQTIFYIIVRDISVQKAIEAELIAKEASLNQAQKLAGLGNWLINFATHTTEWSEGMYEIYGIDKSLTPPPPDESYFKFTLPEEQPLVRQIIQRSKHETEIEYEQRIIRQNGDLRYLLNRVRGLYNPEGKWLGLYGTTLDITQLKKVEVELKSKSLDIQESLLYAKKIQEAILPTEADIQKYFPEHFVYFRPREVVSGDFYWVGFRNYRAIIACVDCTGHGVPGAFMSMIANELLNELVNKEGITLPNQLLDELRIGIRRVLRQEETQNQDGMDISICTFEIIPPEYKALLKFPKLEYAGAGQPLYWLQNQELKTVKADKTSIGGVSFYEKDKPFNRFTIEVNTPTTFYLCSDGFRDQFGADNRTRFMGQRFKELLNSIHHLPMAQQKNIIDQTLQKWMGNTPQVDDILIIGVKLDNAKN
ncbi:MAG: PAS domain S-box protein [Microscillaceae bacterium]|jgi:PAS domain S-box-containing protein|nr:PAS domain S-box protein [Microscillaceae bacterium]